MSDGISDMHRDEERKAEELVEKCCNNCLFKDSQTGFCDNCQMTYHSTGRYPHFITSQSAVDAKVKELRTKEPVGIQAVIENGTVFTCGSLSCLLDTPSVGTNSHCRCLSGLDFADKLKVGRYIQREKALKKEMLACLKALVKWNTESTSKDLGAICEDAEKLIEKVEGK